MKKIGIITLSGNYNYGNRLQNYAMQEVYKKLGFEAETIWNKMCSDNKTKFPILVRLKNEIKPMIGRTNYVKIVDTRRRNFENFTDTYIKNSNYIIKNDNDNSKLNEMYDYFSIGSDQVWNYTFGFMSSVDFLKFADSEKTIAYAPSFGFSYVPDVMKDIYVDGLNHIKYLSCREDAGAKIIKDLTGRDAKVVLDPTMLLEKEDYDKIEKEPDININKKYILLYFLGNISETKQKEIEELKEKYDLDVINLCDINDAGHSAGPSEFLYLFHHSELVLTDSFHACVFSILYDKPFYVFDRDQEISNMNSRLDTLLGMLNLKERKISSLKKQKNVFDADYTNAKKIINKKKKECFEYINNSLGVKENSVETILKNKCSGCSSCMNKCPNGAIKMKFDKEGFRYPEIDKEKCTNCGLCKKACPYLKKQDVSEMKTYACFNKNKQEQLNSSSGGIFILLAKYILNNNGLVVGAGFDNKHNLKHLICENEQDLIKLQGSKYLQSEIGTTYKKIQEELKNNRLVLYTGTPCQIAGLKAFLNKDYDNLYTQDIVCHGCPSKVVFDSYLSSFKNEIKNISFRNKPNGWLNYNTTISFKNNKFYNNSHYNDKYMYLFLKDYCLRPSCYECKYKGEQRFSDITLADFWGINEVCKEMFNSDGTSLLMVNSKKGLDLFNSIKKDLEYKEVNRKESLKYNPSACTPVNKPNVRDEFMDDALTMEFDKLYDKYHVKESLKIRIKNRIKREIGR